MRKYFYLLFFIFFISPPGGNKVTNGYVRPVNHRRTRPLNQNIVEEIIIDTNLLASKKDLVCYMPLWTGIGDTCLYHGKIYGFCSKSCKEDFLKNPLSFLPWETDMSLNDIADTATRKREKRPVLWHRTLRYSKILSYFITSALSIRKFRSARSAFVCSLGETAVDNCNFIFFNALYAAATEA